MYVMYVMCVMYVMHCNAEAKTAMHKDALMPKEMILATCLIEDRQFARAAVTWGYGACSPHCLWGSVVKSHTGNMYLCEEARRKQCEAMLTDANETLKSPCAAAIRELDANILSELIDYVMRRTKEEPSMPGDCMGVEVLWQPYWSYTNGNFPRPASAQYLLA